MQARRIARVLLLTFVAASLGYSGFQEVRGRGTFESAGSSTPATPSGGEPTEEGSEARPLPRRWIAYYFHGTKRCNTCRAIESQAREAIETGFPEAMLSGLLEWREMDVDLPTNARFVKEFGLTGSSLVLAEYRDGRQARFKTLGRVWDLVADWDAFRSYVQEEVRSWLEGSE